MRSIERLWAQRSERAVVFSPREWTLVESWYERGIPLSIIEEAIEYRAEGRRARRPPRSLSYLAPAVEEAWRVIVEGRIDHSVVSDAVGSERQPLDSLACWRRARELEQTPEEIRKLLDELLAEAARGVDAQALDRRMDLALPVLASRDLLKSLRGQVLCQVAPYRDRMTAEVLETTIRRAVVAQLRRALGLPRLASDATLPNRPGGGEASVRR